MGDVYSAALTVKMPKYMKDELEKAAARYRTTAAGITRTALYSFLDADIDRGTPSAEIGALIGEAMGRDHRAVLFPPTNRAGLK